MYEYDCPHYIGMLYVEDEEWQNLVWCECGALVGEIKKGTNLRDWYYDDEENSPLWI